MAYGQSNGHVSDDVTWPWKVKLVTPIRLERSISKIAGDAIILATIPIRQLTGSWHSLLKRFKCIRKTCRKFDSLLSKTYWIFSMRQHVHLKKWTLKFKNCCIYWTRRTIFNKICRICGLNPHLLPSQIWWIYLPQFQRYRIFPKGLLFWRALYVYTRYNNMRYKNHRAQPIACRI